MKTMFGKRYPNCVKKTKLREDIELNPNERVYDYEEGRDTVPEKLPFDIDKLVNSGVVFVTPAINGNPKSKNYKKWMKTPHTHLISLYNVENSSEDGWILKAITKRAPTKSFKSNFVDKIYDGKYNQILWSLEKLGINPMDMLNDANLQESIIKVLREESTQDSLYEIIITENQQESIKIELQSMVKDIGWELTAKIVNGPKKLVKLAFNNDPMEFLNLFNDLNVVQSREEFYWSLFRYKKRNNLMIYDRKNNSLNVSKKIFWSFLEEGFGLNHSKIRELMRIWLYDTYNLKGDRTFELISVFDWEKSSLSRMG
jgi:hypothetical protein